MWKGRKRKTKNIYKIVRRPVEPGLKANIKKQTEKIKKDGKRRVDNC